MDLYEAKIRLGQLSSDLRALSWKDPDQRKVLVLLVGGAVVAVLLPIAAWVLLGSAVTTSDAERAAALNNNAPPQAATPLSQLERVRDELSPRLREDPRFSAVLVRPGASAEAPDAVATLQGDVADRPAFDALVALLNEMDLSDAVHLRIAISPPKAQPSPGG